MTQPRTSFDWAIYADATFAGLAVLIPLIGVDWLFEEIFRRRMPTSIAKRRGRTLAPFAKKTLNRGPERPWWQSCLLIPPLLLFWFLKRLSRKILYFLTIKEATDRLSYYWHRAFLIDYVLLSGHLDETDTAQRARQAMDQVLDTTQISPLYQLAWQITHNVRHVFKTLRRARRGQEDEMVTQQKTWLSHRWSEVEDYLWALAARYDEAYQALQTDSTSDSLKT